MAKLIMLSGLPASGKSTKAEEIIRTGGNWIRVNRDLLRTMLHFDKFTGVNEGITVNVERVIASNALINNYNVVVDDTNLNPKNKEMWKQIADAQDAEFEHVAIETGFDECIARDAAREKRVGKHVILGMAMQYKLMPDIGTGFILCDLDGTLCNVDHRLHFVKVSEGEKKDWKGFFGGIKDDPIREDVKEMVLAKASHGHPIIFMSARPETYRKETEAWLNENFKHPYFTLIMRKAHDKRPDTEVKQEMYNTFFKDKYPVQYVFDDRPSVIRMWQSNGLNVIDVGHGVEF